MCKNVKDGKNIEYSLRVVDGGNVRVSDFYINAPDIKFPNGSTRVQDENQNAFLYADLGGVTAATINQLRQAFQIQKLLEKDARGGTRYRAVPRGISCRLVCRFRNILAATDCL